MDAVGNNQQSGLRGNFMPRGHLVTQTNLEGQEPLMMILLLSHSPPEQ